ncbi:hypothetical protein [Candidatus Rhabdochlamydia porcellionis]|jgi:hypothetical protein|uniref:Fungal lipase-like domain-containing protein n=1 Tax=Candidatus Rhabdochlamydia porcellionis TaxID=225148 RepID=A0ABX8YZN6_9BACT|nr:hypothetical protein [Candidatus Rhabdochlamydia porcellionis]QZA58860.1 hypothetical protein RHAB15C_0000740 [Candidatus Rhabdochlamydia porcellionis]
MWKNMLSISKSPWFFHSPNSKNHATINPLNCIKKLIQELPYCQKTTPSISKRKVAIEPWSSLLWENLLYLFFLLKIKLLPHPTSNISQLKNLLTQEQVEKKIFIEYASNVFGKRVMQAIQKDIDSLPDFIEKKDLCHVFAMIGHALTTNDLTDLLKRVNTGEVPLKLSRSLSTDLSELSSEDMEKLVGFYRNPLEHLLPNEKKILWEEIEKSGIPINNRILANEEYEYHIRKLAGKLEKEEKYTKEDLKLLPFAISEQLARTAAYAQPDTIRENMIIPILIFTEQQDIVYYQLNNHINQNGLHCYLFTPLKGDFPAQLVFRGTDDSESFSRNVLDPNGIGKTVFDECKDQIAAMIEAYCKTAKCPALDITGHSLGGLDAQRATILCLERFNQENNHNPISCLSDINCFAFCSPKLDQATIKSWEEQINILKNHPSPPQISLNFCYHKNDLLTQAGFKNLYIKEHLSFLHGNYLQVTSNSGILATNTHHRKSFFKGGKFYSSTDDRKYIHYNSADFTYLKEKMDALQKIMGKESEVNLSKEDLEILESSKKKLVTMRKNQEEIQSYQEGYSSDSSWGIFFADKLFITPGQWLFHWMKSQEKRLFNSSWKTSSIYKLLMASRKQFSHWVKSHYIKV